MIQPNDHDVFELRQRFRLVINRYEFTLLEDAWRTQAPKRLIAAHDAGA